MAFPGIPSFSPEIFAYMKNPNPSAYKNFRKGLQQLLDEGAVQMLRARSDQGMLTARYLDVLSWSDICSVN